MSEEDMKELIAACDLALDWADANARWFDISTAPIGIEGGSRFEVWHKCGFSQEVWSTNGKIWHESDEEDQIDLSGLSHWRPLPQPPSNPPLPEPRVFKHVEYRNVYDTGVCENSHSEKIYADRSASYGRLACVRVEITATEGQFDD